MIQNDCRCDWCKLTNWGKQMTSETKENPMARQRSEVWQVTAIEYPTLRAEENGAKPRVIIPLQPHLASGRDMAIAKAVAKAKDEDVIPADWEASDRTEFTAAPFSNAG